MTAHRGRGKWAGFKARVRKQIARHNGDGLEVFLARLEMLASRVQPSHGVPADEVERQVQIWQRLLEGVDTGEAADVDDGVNSLAR
jgi:hypothetical protein